MTDSSRLPPTQTTLPTASSCIHALPPSGALWRGVLLSLAGSRPHCCPRPRGTPPSLWKSRALISDANMIIIEWTITYLDHEIPTLLDLSRYTIDELDNTWRRGKRSIGYLLYCSCRLTLWAIYIRINGARSGTVVKFQSAEVRIRDHAHIRFSAYPETGTESRM